MRTSIAFRRSAVRKRPPWRNAVCGTSSAFSSAWRIGPGIVTDWRIVA
jgi:hypothetical protein